MVIGRLRRDPARSQQRTRALVAVTGISLWAVVLVVRLVNLQVYQHDTLVDRARQNRTMTIELAGLRGDIFARGGEVLATSIELRSIYAQRDEIEDPDRIADLLAPALNVTRAELRKKLDGSGFRYLRRKAPPSMTTAVRRIVSKHKLRGINWVKESKRFYPQKELGAQIIGAVNIDNEGRFGIERAYESWIAGEKGTHLAVRDNLGHVIGSRAAMLDNPTRGDDLVLTIDAGLQYTAEEALREAVLRTEAEGGVAVVMDPYTGNLLAVANYPTFDLNNNNHPDFRTYQTNRAVAHAIEPGSVLKVVTVAAALHEQLITEEDIIDCQGGLLRVPGGVIRDWKPGFEKLSVREVLMNSSNVGTVKIAVKMSAEKHHQWLLDFGFAGLSGVDLPGEVGGYLARPGTRAWSRRTQETISFGQEISATPLQVTSALAAIANGGKLMRPRILHEVRDRFGARREDRLLRDGTPVGSSVVRHRVLDSQIARRVALMMESVVDDGTGSPAQVAGYRIGGKTSTAQKFDNELGAYGGFVAGFGGFLPISDPRVVIFVAIDEPKRGSSWGHGGSTAAGPVFRTISEAAIRILRIAPDAAPDEAAVADAGDPDGRAVSPLP
ncbi:MAG: penicillin-binding protein [Acidobacteria bacterium]|nr:penicillin-binding protein [Acidobacteriota bacterium]